MRISGNDNRNVAASDRTRPAPHEFAPGEATAATEPQTGGSRALIAISPARTAERTHAVVRQPAGFLAHLIATQQAVPQTRERRRLEPHFAAAIYSAAHDATAAEIGRTLACKM